MRAKLVSIRTLVIVSLFIVSATGFADPFVDGDNGIQGTTNSTSRLHPKTNGADTRLNVEEPPQSFGRSGPRVGINIISGDLAKGLTRQDYLPVMMLFGWQFEQVLTTGSGNAPSVVFEEIPMFGGLEQNLLSPSFTFIIGLRMASGFEFGLGPTIIWPTVVLGENRSMGTIHTAVTFGAGHSIRAGQFNFPINLVFIPGYQPGQSGLRTIFTTGVNW